LTSAIRDRTSGSRETLHPGSVSTGRAATSPTGPVERTTGGAVPDRRVTRGGRGTAPRTHGTPRRSRPVNGIVSSRPGAGAGVDARRSRGATRATDRRHANGRAPAGRSAPDAHSEGSSVTARCGRAGDGSCRSRRTPRRSIRHERRGQEERATSRRGPPRCDVQSESHSSTRSADIVTSAL
jgi:hypothetical protein